MTIIIQDVNYKIIRDIIPNVVFSIQTADTSAFDITENEFVALKNKIKEAGYNPYELMSW